ncbi:ferric reductase-like transmembrane domain-containing protein [Lysobacter antibioticus]|uniref:ferric reductase-like transmembrane domain-containing protein n=1 Tax=Lysobacter antibioticus TaxID=84531 RepID=UPI0007E8D0FC|nr:ferric reductase-like transmembrane domain-containing protein [Lysobacter antibioticus]
MIAYRSGLRPQGWPLFWLLAALVLLMSATLLAAHADPVAGVRAVIRATARSSVALFLSVFVASSLTTLVPNGLTRALLRERRYLGLAFAFSHLVHAIAIVRLGQLDPSFWLGRSALTNLPGGLGYAFIVLLSATSFHALAQRMGAQAWKRLHTAGVWVIALIFALSYFKRIPTDPLYALPFALMCAAVAVRAVGKWAQSEKRRWARQRRAPSPVSPNLEPQA